MRIIEGVVVALLLCTPALAAGPVTAPRTVPMVAGNIQAMKINEVIRMKVENAQTFEAAGIKGLRPGEDIEVRKIAKDKLEVKRLSTGQVGVIPAE